MLIYESFTGDLKIHFNASIIFQTCSPCYLVNCMLLFSFQCWCWKYARLKQNWVAPALCLHIVQKAKNERKIYNMYSPAPSSDTHTAVQVSMSWLTPAITVCIILLKHSHVYQLRLVWLLCSYDSASLHRLQVECNNVAKNRHMRMFFLTASDSQQRCFLDLVILVHVAIQRAVANHQIVCSEFTANIVHYNNN